MNQAAKYAACLMLGVAVGLGLSGCPLPGPGPAPGPTPPGPVPPAPIPVAGLHVLIIYESAEKGPEGKVKRGMPPEQQAILTAAEVLGYLNAKCPKGPDGRTAEWRVWDWDVPTGAESKLWQDAMARKPTKDKLPWIIVSDGKSGFEGPLPRNIADMMVLLRKWGG